MTEFEVATLTAQYVIGLGQIGIVWYGISRMVRANEQRAEAGERQARESDRRHTDTMREADRRHAETMAALNAQGQALKALIVGMETMIERTRGRGERSTA